MLDRVPDVQAGVTALIRLRRIGRTIAPSRRGELRAVEDFLRDLIGNTLRPSEAARLLGISRPSLKRWLDSGDIASVITPGGRREVPVSELVELLEELDQLDDNEREGRPVSRVIRARRLRARESIDLDRLLPRQRDRGHRLAELQALAYHRYVAERLDDELVEHASHRLAKWRASGRIHESWAERWQDVLGKPIPEIAKAISADTKRARELRQTSPFAGVLNEQERQLLVHAVRERGS